MGRVKSVLIVGLVAAGLSAFAAANAVAAPPANDNFANAQSLAGPLPIAVAGSNVEATREVGEPFYGFGAGHTIWFQWEATLTGFVTVGTCDASFHTETGVFTGASVGALTKVADATSGGPGCPSASGRQATFKATSGTVYSIAIDGNGMSFPGEPKPVSEGAVALLLEATPVPANDDLGTARPLTGSIEEEPDGNRLYFGSGGGFNWNATKQPGEPDHAGDPGGASVWYAWAAPASGLARIGVNGNGFNPLIAVYGGSSFGTLTEVGSGQGFISPPEIPVSAGTTYLIAVDGKRDSGTGAASVASPLASRFHATAAGTELGWTRFGRGCGATSDDDQTHCQAGTTRSKAGVRLQRAGKLPL